MSITNGTEHGRHRFEPLEFSLLRPCCLVVAPLIHKLFALFKMHSLPVKTVIFRACFILILIDRVSALTNAGPITKQNSAATLIEHSRFRSDQVRNAWRVLVPAIWEKSHGIDVTVHWSFDEECSAAAEKCVDAIEKKLTPQQRLAFSRSIVKENIATSMESFVAVCANNLRPKAFKARLVCGRSASSAKCPRWHVDQVPLRYIQSFIGPGCQYLECNEPFANFALRPSNREIEDDDSDTSTLHDYCDRLVQRHPEFLYQVPEGDAVILTGNEWPGNHVDPCIHKSPSGLMPWDGRILFTIDVILH